jgi:Lrp/AsnC family transcriptional regulator, regulator for asnA, asnC and gidA
MKTPLQSVVSGRCEFDDIDSKLVDLLNQDVRQSYKSLAMKINVDQVTVKRRLKKLIDQGIIKLGVMVDYSRIGVSVEVLFAFTAELGSLDSVLKEISSRRQISWVSSVAGRFDLIALARFASNDELIEFIHQELKKIRGLKNAETFILLRRTKGSFAPFSKKEIENEAKEKQAETQDRSSPESS